MIDEGIRERLLKFMLSVLCNHDCKVISINCTANHVHVLMAMGADKTLSEMVRNIKANSSRFVHEEFPTCVFGWQDGYAAFTVSRSQMETVAKYVEGQEEHHRKIGFDEEFVGFLKRHGG
ncbi:MAG: hypothetical protein A2Y07_08715 [Planctomycetes bacterium GWF2_50_10]|nr:MAG: hypothetical protein A2Y07_08715 [Planctomycetes bacterium GWF2_50_10]